MRKIMIYFVLFLIVFIVGCSSNETNFKIAYEGKGGFGYDVETKAFCLSELISSREELESLSNRYSSRYFDESSENYNSEIGILIRSYDDVFFDDRSLIICVILSGNGFYYKIKLDVNEDKLIINLKKSRKKGTFTDELFSYLFIIEVEKKDFSNINRVESIIYWWDI